MLFSGLKTAKIIPRNMHLDVLVDSQLNGDESAVEEFLGLMGEAMTGPRKQDVVHYSKWEKKKQTGKTGKDRELVAISSKRDTVENAVKDMMDSFQKLVEHLGRNRDLKAEIKTRRCEVLEDETMAMVQVDWSENLQIPVSGKLHTHICICVLIDS